jgi:Zn-dependent M28 family amino/carboxypeptidase
MRRFACLLLVAACLPAQEKPFDTVGRIKVEAFQNSKVMEELSFLSDLYGPRLTGSPEFVQAVDWAVSRLKEYGLTNVHTEKWGPFGRAWSLEGYSLEMISPRYSHLTAVPLAWSASTNGVLTGEAFYAPIESTNSIDIEKDREAFHKYEAKWKGKLRGKIVLVSEPPVIEPPTRPSFRRLTDADLAEISQAPDPFRLPAQSLDDIKMPSDPGELGKLVSHLPSSIFFQLFDKYKAFGDERGRFFTDEGAAAVIRADERAHNGLVFAEAAGSHLSKDPLAPPTFVVTEEQYSRMTRLIESKHIPVLRLNVAAKSSNTDVDGMNIIGEIRGETKPDEVVMIGAHFDSWHAATGATDNGAGSAVMIEVMRILKAAHIKLDRTVRIGLWSGEEQGLYGSRAYVKSHFGPELDKFDVYLNLDNGSGKIRGVYLQGNDAARPLFEAALQPFHDMGATAVTLRNTGGTDHLSFDSVGLPGFQFIQDPLDYGTITHHSAADAYSHAVPEDLMQAAAVIASVVSDFANQPQQFPRKPQAMQP